MPRVCPNLNLPRCSFALCSHVRGSKALTTPMSFWRKIAGLAVRSVDEADCSECPAGLPGEDPAFSTAVTGLGAKLAKADGMAHASEYDAFSQVFQPDEGSQNNIRRLYQLARQTTRGYES